MKTPKKDYNAGPNARKAFERTMKVLFKAPKLKVENKPKKGKD